MDGTWLAEVRALLGKRVNIWLDKSRITNGILLGFGDGGDFEILEGDGSVHYCWPLLRIEAVAGPPFPKDQGILARDIDRAASLVSGLGEHGLANQLWALAGRVRGEARLGGRYVKGNTDQTDYQRPGWGSLRGQLTVSDDWDSHEVNDEIGRPFREGGSND